MKTTAKKLFFFLLRYSGIPFLLFLLKQKKRVTIIYYHAPRPDHFAEHIACMKKWGYNIIPLKTCVDALVNKTWDKLPPYPVVITFDDGHSSNYHLKSVMESEKTAATIFLTVDVCGTDNPFWFLSRSFTKEEKLMLKEVSDAGRRSLLIESAPSVQKMARQALSWEEIAEMSSFVDFQSHTLSHPCLPRCTDEEASMEIEKSKEYLETKTGEKVYAICWPNGDYTTREIEIARKAGYTCGLTGDHGFVNKDSDLFTIKRVSINDTGDINEFITRITGLWGKIKKWRSE